MNIRKSSQRIFLGFSLIFSGTTFACEFHDGYGLGGHLQGRFSSRHSYSPESIQQSLAESPNSWLNLSTQSMISSKINEKTEIKVEYKLLQKLSKVNFLLESSPDVKVINSIQTEINPESGRYAFTIIPSKAGIIKLVIIANTNEDGNVKTFRKIVYLHSIQNPV